MKNFLSKPVTLISTGLSYLFITRIAFADVEVNPCPTDQFSGLCDLDANNIGSIVSRIVTVLLIAAAVISLFFLIWGGIRWITSGGDKSKVDSARQTIIASIIGLIIALLAFFIITVVLGLFNLSLTDLTLPKLIIN